MRVEQAVINVQKSDDFEEANFSIKRSPKAFSILSSKLYSDPHLAIVRELSTNAWDAHVEAGTENIPFDVHLPNSMEPFFAIRDYGTGMSHENTMRLYTTYFESTKTDTNDLVGCLGLGSKSPFSYTDNFSVTCWYNGKKRHYGLHIGKDGFPMIALLRTLDSDEHSGVEVRFACKKDDTDLFLEKAQSVYRKFPVQPNFQGNSKFVAEDRTATMHGPNWKIYNDRHAQSFAIMGCIGYPIQYVHLQGEAHRLILSSSVDITFPIGSLEIAANREELQYSDHTKKALSKAISIVVKQIAEKIDKKFESCKSLWEARVLYLRLFVEFNAPFHYLNSTVGAKVQWKGQSPKIDRYTPININGVAECVKYSLREDKSSKKFVRRANDQSAVTIEEGVRFLIDDMDKKSGEKIRSWIKQENIKTVYVVNLTSWTRKCEKALHAKLGTNAGSFRTTSSLPKPIRRSPVRNGTQGNSSVVPIERRGFTFDDETAVRYGHPEYFWKRVDIDTTKPGVYVPWKRNEGAIDGLYRHPRVMADVLASLNEIGSGVNTLYAFKAGYLNRVLDKEPKWISLTDYAKASLEYFIQTKNLAEPIKNRLGCQKLDMFDLFRCVAEQLEEPSPLKEFVDKVNSTATNEKDTNTAIRLANLIGYDLEQNTLEEQNENIKKRYPMLKWLANGYWYHDKNGSRFKEAARYVEMIDRIEEQNVR